MSKDNQMSGRRWRAPGGIAIFGAAASTCLVLASAGAAVNLPGLHHCPQFERDGREYHYDYYLAGWTCSTAKPWVVKLSDDPVSGLSPAIPRVLLRNGPRGFTCYAVAEFEGHADGGFCLKRVRGRPRSGLGWQGVSPN
jgi:hypothetical protein